MLRAGIVSRKKIFLLAFICGLAISGNSDLYAHDQQNAFENQLLNIALNSPKSSKANKALSTTVSALSQNPVFRSVENQELIVLRIPARDKSGNLVNAKYKFLVEGCLHGDEEVSCVFVAWLVSRLVRGESPLNELQESFVAFDFLPVANPDGLKNSKRLNSNGVNLNRNFGVLWGESREKPGQKAFSEPETQAIKFLVENQDYTAAVDIHGYAKWIVGPSDPLKIGKDSANNEYTYRKWVSILNSGVTFLNKNLTGSKPYEFTNAGKLGDGGAFEDWVFWSTGTPAFCLEISTNSRPVSQSTRLKIDDLFAVYEKLLFNVFKSAIDLNGSAKVHLTQK